ncbi:MAG: hypothetical protein ACL7AX_12435, partial [Candidatus Arsenophonus phytopathogenicus]
RIGMMFTAKIGDHVTHIDKDLLQRFVVIQQKGQHVVEGDAVFGGKGFLVYPENCRFEVRLDACKR